MGKEIIIFEGKSLRNWEQIDVSNDWSERNLERKFNNGLKNVETSFKKLNYCFFRIISCLYMCVRLPIFLRILRVDSRRMGKEIIISEEKITSRFGCWNWEQIDVLNDF